MWLVMSVILYIGSRWQVGIRLGCFAFAALISTIAALRNAAPLVQLQLFLAGSLTTMVLVPRFQRLSNRF